MALLPAPLQGQLLPWLVAPGTRVRPGEVLAVIEYGVLAVAAQRSRRSEEDLMVDTPGFMAGPATDARAQERHASRLFVVAAQLRVPVLTVVLRKGYGLGAMGLTAGGFHAPVCTVAWPSAECGAMGLEGAVRQGSQGTRSGVRWRRARRFVCAVAGRADRAGWRDFERARPGDRAVIDPAETRNWLDRGLASATAPEGGPGRFVDPW